MGFGDEPNCCTAGSRIRFCFVEASSTLTYFFFQGVYRMGSIPVTSSSLKKTAEMVEKLLWRWGAESTRSPITFQLGQLNIAMNHTKKNKRNPHLYLL